MAEDGGHKHGRMDTSEQERTFIGFIRFAKWTVTIVVVILLLLAIFRI